MKAFLVSILIVFPVHSNAEIIRIAVASSLVRPLENIIRQYHSTDPGHEIKMSIGASGVLFNQIQMELHLTYSFQQILNMEFFYMQVVMPNLHLWNFAKALWPFGLGIVLQT